MIATITFLARQYKKTVTFYVITQIQRMRQTSYAAGIWREDKTEAFRVDTRLCSIWRQDVELLQ